MVGLWGKEIIGFIRKFDFKQKNKVLILIEVNKTLLLKRNRCYIVSTPSVRVGDWNTCYDLYS